MRVGDKLHPYVALNMETEEGEVSTEYQSDQLEDRVTYVG